jgi:hypothetical protein
MAIWNHQLVIWNYYNCALAGFITAGEPAFIPEKLA